MSDVIIASNQADAEAAEQVVAHHAAMQGQLGLLVARLEAASTGTEALQARDAIVSWARAELVPHAMAEEEVLYAAAATLPAHRVLVEAMIAEHRLLASLIEAVADAGHPVTAISAAGGLHTLLDAHVDKENSLILPALVSSPDHSLADLLHQMHAALPPVADEPAVQAAQASGGCGGNCACGESDGPDLPVLDATQIPHAIRHATIFGALDAVGSGDGMVLRAPHDPLPLLAQLEERSPGAFSVSYLVEGPEVWDLQLVRR